MNYRIEPVSENSLIIYVESDDLKTANAQLQQLCATLTEQLDDKLTEWIPAYNSLLLSFKRISHKALIRQIEQILRSQPNCDSPLQQTTLHQIPVCYHPSLAPDLMPLARAKKLSVDELVALHSGIDYRVYAIGFAPGFAYLGEVDARICAPRHATPRANVFAGSVGIADRQTAIYPASSPGGWQIIGRAVATLFDPQNSPACPLNVGDEIRFTPISLSDFTEQGGNLER